MTDLFPSVPLVEVFINAKTLQIMAITGKGIWWCDRCRDIWPDSHLVYNRKTGTLLCPLERQ